MMGRFERSTDAAGTNAVSVGPARKLVRAQQLVRQGDSPRALTLFREVIKLGETPYLQEACVGAGNAYLTIRRYELADACYVQALESGGDGDLYAESLQNLGIARYVRGDRSGACEVMEELAVLDHPVFSPLARDNLEVLFGIRLG